MTIVYQFISNRIQVQKKEIQDSKDEMCQLEDKKQNVIKLVSGDPKVGW